MEDRVAYALALREESERLRTALCRVEDRLGLALHLLRGEFARTGSESLGMPLAELTDALAICHVALDRRSSK